MILCTNLCKALWPAVCYIRGCGRLHSLRRVLWQTTLTVFGVVVDSTYFVWCYGRVHFL